MVRFVVGARDPTTNRYPLASPTGTPTGLFLRLAESIDPPSREGQRCWQGNRSGCSKKHGCSDSLLLTAVLSGFVSAV